MPAGLKFSFDENKISQKSQPLLVDFIYWSLAWQVLVERKEINCNRALVWNSLGFTFVADYVIARRVDFTENFINFIIGELFAKTGHQMSKFKETIARVMLSIEFISSWSKSWTTSVLRHEWSRHRSCRRHETLVWVRLLRRTDCYVWSSFEGTLRTRWILSLMPSFVWK